MKRKNSVLTAAVLSVGAVAALSQVAQAKPHDRDDRQDVKEARREVKEARKQVREERREARRANTPQERRQERQDVREARENLRDARQDLRRERREDGNGNVYYTDRYYRNGQPYNGYYNGYNYNNGYRPNTNSSYNYGYNRPNTNSGYGYNNSYNYDDSYSSGYNYNNGYYPNTNNRYNNNYGYNNGQRRTFEGVVVRDNGAGNTFVLRANNGLTIRVRTQSDELRGVSRGDVVRVSGYTQNNNVFFAEDVRVLRNR